jgi:hypothetical protein
LVSPGVGGFNPNLNNPTNRPGGVQANSAAIEAGRVNRGIDVQKAASTPVADQPAQAALPKAPEIARRMSLRDVVSQLVTLGVPTTEENRSLAVKMLMHGLELSKDNLNKIMTLLKGLPGTAANQEAAVLALLKGFDGEPGIVQLLAPILARNPGLAKVLANLSMQMSQISALMQSGQNLLQPGLASQLLSLMSGFSSMVSDLPRKLREDGQISSKDLLNSLRGLKGLIDGSLKQAPNQVDPKSSLLMQQLKGLSDQMEQAISQLTTQAVLSKPSDRTDQALPDKFAYWNIPNSMGTPPRDAEILIKRDPNKKNKINPKNTKVILKLETGELGELGIEMDVNEDNVGFQFNTLNDETKTLIMAQMEELRRKLELRNFKAKVIKVVKKSLNTKEYLMPSLDLDNLMRVQTEA